MKIFLDDVRKPPKGWIKVKNYYSFVIVVFLFKRCITDISFDHDLGTKHTGYDCANYIEKLAFYGRIQPIDWYVHSANPAGRDRIIAAMESASRFWTQKKG